MLFISHALKFKFSPWSDKGWGSHNLSHLICAWAWDTHTIVCCLSYTAGQCMWDMFSVEQCSAAILLQSRYVSRRKCCSNFCKKYSASMVLCKRTIYRTAKKYLLTDSMPDKNRIRKFIFFLNYENNVNSQNNRCVTKISHAHPEVSFTWHGAVKCTQNHRATVLENTNSDGYILN